MGWKAKSLGLALGLAALAGTAGAAPPVFDLGRARAAFTVDLPEGCVLEDGAVRASFAIFYVSCEGRVYAGIYAGNAADRAVPRSRIMVTDTRWPSEVQAWAADVPGDQARADAIAASVRVRRVKIAWG
ncbi:hypothetical protein [Phenylobacterium sp.]|jgi:hypothetical protein|uniref:hypothetical protein n=1 Tax=Phenylobacterium sp. TaxID=1871053 RepID=UPI002EDBAD84